MPATLVLDANLLVLLLVGLADRELIARHKRTQTFELADFDLLVDLLKNYEQIAVTPNVMTEASNLASQIYEPARSKIRAQITKVALVYREEYMPSARAAVHKDFIRLGLTDSGLLDLIGNDCPLLTVDLDLYLAAVKGNVQATNFNHLRQSRILDA